MTAITHPSKVEGAGNNDLQGAFDAIFPGITAASDPSNALASHPILKVWSNSSLNSIVAGTGDAKVFWSTVPTYEVPAGSGIPGSIYRAIPTHTSSSGADWANNSNMTTGTGDPAAGKGRVLRGDTDYLPLLPVAQDFLGDGNALVNRIPFNLAAAIHSNTSPTAGDVYSYITVFYTFANNDPGLIVRGNTNAGGEPSATGITTVDHTHMKCLWGDTTYDASLIGTNFALKPADSGASNSNPFMSLPSSGFKYCDKIVAWDLNA